MPGVESVHPQVVFIKESIVFHFLYPGEILLPRLVGRKSLHHDAVAIFLAFQFDTVGGGIGDHEFVVASERSVRVVGHTSLRLPEIMHQVIVGIERQHRRLLGLDAIKRTDRLIRSRYLRSHRHPLAVELAKQGNTSQRVVLTDVIFHHPSVGCCFQQFAATLHIGRGTVGRRIVKIIFFLKEARLQTQADKGQQEIYRSIFLHHNNV